MAYGKRDRISYLDGLPVKISEQVRGPRKITLPVNFHPTIPADLLTEDYDFSLEQQVLASAESRRQAIEQLEKAKVEKVASDIEDFTKVNNQSDEIVETNVALLREERPEERNEQELPPSSVQLPSWQPSTTILMPQPLASKDPNNGAPFVQPKEFNLADFENETSPFDYMELQTINDLEELNTVFQGMAMTNRTLNDGKRFSRTHGNSISDAIIDDSKNAENLTPLTIDAKNDRVSYSSLAHFPNKVHSTPGLHLSNGYSLQHQVLYDLSRYPQMDAMGSNGFSEDTTPKLRSAKSVSDIYSALEGSSGSQKIRSHTPPPAPAHLVKKLIGATENSSSLPQSTHQEMTTNPDPFSDLNEEQQTFVTTLTEMGFPRARVSRGVKQLGTDYKKVVDYLCLVQSLEDSGYDGWDTEMALHLHNYSIEEAKSFLDLLRQFQDLGFDKDLARKALVRHKNDRDKALDSLLT